MSYYIRIEIADAKAKKCPPTIFKKWPDLFLPNADPNAPKVKANKNNISVIDLMELLRKEQNMVWESFTIKHVGGQPPVRNSPSATHHIFKINDDVPFEVLDEFIAMSKARGNNKRAHTVLESGAARHYLKTGELPERES